MAELPPTNLRQDPVAHPIWDQGVEIEKEAIEQMRRAAQLPISVAGALMPDAHVGYGLPIGGVLAAKNALIPYGVGVDIACRVSMTIFNVPPLVLEQKREKIREALEENTVFGAGGHWDSPPEHAVLEDQAFEVLPIVKKLKDTAREQLGTSGSGNHFVEFGVVHVHETIEGTGESGGEGSRTYGKIPPGTYVALLSHSGSRGLGFNIANHYTEVAMALHPELPKAYRHLAWLDMDTAEGQEYWLAMNLAGRYASANHAIIHRKMIDVLRFEVFGGVENHHNFAWLETHQGESLYVHRKGATPAGLGVYGVIPGSMSAPGFIVRGKGNEESLRSAAHGAGRRMSRKTALNSFRWEQVEHKLRNAEVELLSAGLDEAPGAYKDIHQVMEAQANLVEIIAEFQPRMVKMDADKTWRREYNPAGKSPDQKRYKDKRGKKGKPR